MTSKACCSNMISIILNLLAGLILFLSIVELGVVGAATIAVRQSFVIRWWSGTFVCAIFALNKLIVISPILFAFCVVAISMIGGWFDLVFVINSRAVTSCPTESISGFLTSFGLERSEYGIPKTPVVPNRCYCWQANPQLLSYSGGCVEYDLYSGMNCGAIITANTAVSSILFLDAAITVSSIMMLIISCAVVCNRREVVIPKTPDVSRAITDQGLTKPFPSLPMPYSLYSSMINVQK